jgi:hypothetical protein
VQINDRRECGRLLERRFAAGLQPASAVRLLERTTAPHALPHIIADYVGDGAPPVIAQGLNPELNFQTLKLRIAVSICSHADFRDPSGAGLQHA